MLFLAMMAAGPVAAQSGAATLRAGYGPPQAGRLISAEPATSAPAGMTAWRIRYWTRGETGPLVVASGMAVVPSGPAAGGPRPVLAWTHGTWGVVPACGPSLSPKFWTMTAGLDAVKRGYAVVAPDYIGLGSDGVHPFLVGVDTARAVLDSVRALRAVPGAGAGRRFAVWGESQGGHAALWTTQLAPGYAPELKLVAAAAAAPPTDLAANLRHAPNRTAKTFFTALIARSWSQRYGIDLNGLVGASGQRRIAALSDKCISIESKPSLAGLAGMVALQLQLATRDIAALPAWRGPVARNSLPRRPGAAPLLIAQNPADDLVAPAVTRAHAAALCRAGGAVEWVDIKGPGHATSARDSAGVTMDWIDARFAARPMAARCRAQLAPAAVRK